MDTLDIEKLQQELQKLGHERLELDDPLFMDHLARRLELQWHYEKINALLEEQQLQIKASQLEFSESLRKSYSEWINEGGNHLKSSIEQAGISLLEELNTGKITANKKVSLFSKINPVFLTGAFILGFMVAWVIYK